GPERREGVMEREILAGVLRHVAVAHVAREERALEQDQREKRHPAHRPHRAPAAPQRAREPRAESPGDAPDGEDRAAESEEERETSELAHATTRAITSCPSPAPAPRTWKDTS